MAEKQFFRRDSLSPALAGAVTQIAGYAENGSPLRDSVEMASLVVPLVIGFGGAFSIALDRRPENHDIYTSFTAGLHAGHVRIDSAGACACVQVNFTPTGAMRFFRLPMAELANRMVRLDELGDAGISLLTRRLEGEQLWPRRLRLVEDFVIARLAAAPPPDAATHWAYTKILSSSGGGRIAEIGRELGWSRKQIATRFRASMGLTPKSLSQVVRFNGALEMARRTQNIDWADIAFASGYSDQAHFSREFSRFAGMTPTQWQASIG